MRTGLGVDLVLCAASMLATLSGVALLVRTADERLGSLIILLCIFGTIIQVASLILGLPWLAGSSLVALLAAVAIGAAATTEAPASAWITIGCLWFLALELGWEAIDRRDGIMRARAVSWTRITDVGLVVAITVGTGVVAAVGSSGPPVRSLPLQVLVMLVFFVAAVLLSRRLR